MASDQTDDNDLQSNFGRPGIKCPGCGDYFLLKEGEGETVKALQSRVIGHIKRKDGSGHGVEGGISRANEYEVKEQVDALKKKLEESSEGGEITVEDFEDMKPEERMNVVEEIFRNREEPMTVSGAGKALFGTTVSTGNREYNLVRTTLENLRSDDRLVKGRAKDGLGGRVTYELPLDERKETEEEEETEERGIPKAFEDKVEAIKDVIGPDGSSTAKAVTAELLGEDVENISPTLSEYTAVANTLRESDEFYVWEETPPNESNIWRVSGVQEEDEKYGHKIPDELSGPREKKVEVVKEALQELGRATAKEITAEITDREPGDVDTSGDDTGYTAVLNTLKQTDVFGEVGRDDNGSFKWVMGEDADKETGPSRGDVEDTLKDIQPATIPEIAGEMFDKEPEEIETDSEEYSVVANTLKNSEKIKTTPWVRSRRNIYKIEGSEVEMPEDLIPCPLCDYGSNKRVSVQSHFRNEHEPEKYSWRCRECGAVFDESNPMGTHLAKAHGGGMYLTDAEMVHKREIEEEEDEEDEGRTYVCDSCGEEFDDHYTFGGHKSDCVSEYKRTAVVEEVKDALQELGGRASTLEILDEMYDGEKEHGSSEYNALNRTLNNNPGVFDKEKISGYAGNKRKQSVWSIPEEEPEEEDEVKEKDKTLEDLREDAKEVVSLEEERRMQEVELEPREELKIVEVGSEKEREEIDIRIQASGEDAAEVLKEIFS